MRVTWHSKVRHILCKGPSTLTETETEGEVLLLILLSFSRLKDQVTIGLPTRGKGDYYHEELDVQLHTPNYVPTIYIIHI